MTTIQSIFGIREAPINTLQTPARQSVEQTEDYAVKKSILTKELVVDDHESTGLKPQVVNIIYSTEAVPPAANTVPIGTIYIQYTP